MVQPRTSSQRLSEGYRWVNPSGYYAEMTFENGRLTGKTWKKGGIAIAGGVRGFSGPTPPN
ncbi:MAG: hypothetical protein HY706_11900 [Candidatus Hydrogenedentes bacterium]|nr:hypothetical protein [Candidatus Hydrogenedentota bacterium]